MFYSHVMNSEYEGPCIVRGKSVEAVRRKLAKLIAQDCDHELGGNDWQPGSLIGIYEEGDTEPCATFVVRSSKEMTKYRSCKNTLRAIDLDSYTPVVIERLVDSGGFYKKVNKIPGYVFVPDVSEATKFYDGKPVAWALTNVYTLTYYGRARTRRVDSNNNLL